MNTDQNPAYIQAIKSLKRSCNDYTNIKNIGALNITTIALKVIMESSSD